MTSTLKKIRGLRTTALVAAAATVLLVAAAPASAAKVRYGISPQTTLTSTDFTQINSLKTDIIRQGLSWPGVQPAAGNCTAQGDACNWSFPDSQVGASAANGLETMLGIFGSPGFVESSVNKPPLNNLGEWEQFITAAAQRYGPGGAYWSGPYQNAFGAGAPVKPVRVWQIWNEQSSNQFFEPKPDPKKYAKIFKPAAKAIHGVDKKSEVLTGGMFPDTGPKGIKIEPFLKTFLKDKKVRKELDGVSIHPYAKNAKELDKQTKGARKQMDKSGAKKTDIWVTEIGYASGGPKSQPVVKKNEKDQAKAITDAYKFLNKKDKKLGLAGIVYFTWQDVPEGIGFCRFCSFAGLLNTGGAQKPAFNAYKKVAK